MHPQAEGWLPQVTPQVAPQVTPQVERLLAVVDGELLREELQVRLGLADRKHLRTGFLVPAIQAGLLEMTIPDKPNSSKQRYRLTALGRSLRASQANRIRTAQERPQP